MKIGNTVGGLTITDVKRVNKLNLIQFLKEVDSYLQKGYQIDVNSARQVGLVLMTDVYKTEAASNIDVGSTSVGSVGGQVPVESVGVDSKEVESVVPESTVQQEQVNAEAVSEDTAEPVEAVVDTVKGEAPVTEEQSPLTAKKTTTRSKKTAQ